MRELQRALILGLPVNLSSSMEIAAERVSQSVRDRTPLLTTFVNPSAVALRNADYSYKRNLHKFDLIFPDGIAFAKAAEWLRGRPVARISFDTTSLAPPVFAEAARCGRSVLLVGGAPNVAQLAKDRILAEFPTLQVIGAMDGYNCMEEKAATIAQMNPDVVVCGMGAGRQEDFLLRLQSIGWLGCGFTCGGYLDQLCSGFEYYPWIIDRLHLRAFYRLCQEPRRLWRRYTFDYAQFFGKLAAELITTNIGPRRREADDKS